LQYMCPPGQYHSVAAVHLLPCCCAGPHLRVWFILLALPAHDDAHALAPVVLSPGGEACVAALRVYATGKDALLLCCVKCVCLDKGRNVHIQGSSRETLAGLICWHVQPCADICKHSAACAPCCTLHALQQRDPVGIGSGCACVARPRHSNKAVLLMRCASQLRQHQVGAAGCGTAWFSCRR
jgi:hypothetical protein